MAPRKKSNVGTPGTAGRLATRSMISRGEAVLVPLTSLVNGRASKSKGKAATREEPTATSEEITSAHSELRSPAAPVAVEAAKTSRTPRASKTPSVSKTPSPKSSKKKTTKRGKEHSDDDFVPEPDSPKKKKKKSPVADKTYKPSKGSLEAEVYDQQSTSERLPSRSKSRSSKGSPQAGQPVLEGISQSIGRSLEPEHFQTDPNQYDQAVGGGNEPTVSDDVASVAPSSDQENRRPDDEAGVSQLSSNFYPDISDPFNEREQKDSPTDDTYPMDFESDDNDSLDENTGGQRLLPGSPVQRSSFASSFSNEKNNGKKRQKPNRRTDARPKIPQDLDMLRKRAMYTSLKPQSAGYTEPELKSVLKKRPSSGTEQSAKAPKKARFSSPESSQGDQDSEASFFATPTRAIFNRILLVPEALSIAEIGACFVQLQEDTLEFARQFFGFVLDDDQVDAWPLHLLNWDFRGLKLISQWLANGETYSWRTFFTDRITRIPLVQGIIAEYLTDRVFKHTAFSFTGRHLERFEELDQRYLGFDAFVRNKQRAAVLEEIVCETHGFWLAHAESMQRATEALAREVLAILEPLMPPPLFDPARSSRCSLDTHFSLPGFDGPFSEAEKRNAKQIWDFMLHSLQDIIYKAASLHLSIRLTGTDGTNIRILPHVAKDTEFREDGPNECINPKDCRRQRPHPLLEDDQLQIKMTCWSQVEAVVPHGVNLEDYEKIVAQVNEANGSDTSRSFEMLERYFAKTLPILPEELQDGLPKDGEEGPRPPGTEWDRRLAQKASRDDRRQKPHRSAPGVEPENPDRERERGSYVTYYKAIAPSLVYCEWAKIGQGSQHRQSLSEAIEDARQNSRYSLYYGLEDRYVAATNSALRLLARSGLPEQWPNLALWAVFALGCRAMWEIGESVNIEALDRIEAEVLRALRPGGAINELSVVVKDIFKAALDKWKSYVTFSEAPAVTQRLTASERPSGIQLPPPLVRTLSASTFASLSQRWTLVSSAP